jgi:ABC-type glycerol-3-phosphate transport system substrate-binding protein
MKKLFLCIAVLTAIGTIAFAGGRSDSQARASAAPKLVYFAQPPANFKPTDSAVLTKIKGKILADTGTEVDYVIAPIDPNEYLNKINLMLAGGDQVDIFYSNAWEDFQRNGMIADLTAEVNKNPELLKVFGRSFDAMKTPDGRIWGIPRNGDAAHYPLWIRKDWLAKVNLPVPTTIEQYEAVLAAFKSRDPAGNGRTIPMLTDFASMAHVFLGAWADGGSGVYEAPDGKMYPYFMDPGYRDMLAKLNEWYRNGYIDKESFIYRDNQKVDLIKQDRVGASALWFSRVTLNEQELQKLNPAAEYVAAPISGPKGKAQTVNAYPRFSFITGYVGTAAYMVSAKCKDLAAAVRVLAWGFTNSENFVVSRYGMENEGWKWTDRNKGIFEVLVPQTGDEYCMYKGLVTEMAVRENKSANERHIQYIYGKEIVDFSGAKYPKDGGIHFDMKPIFDSVPNVSDILRTVEEESIKFVTGGRPLGEYNAFINDLRRLGIDKVSEELTKQYRAQKK